MPNNFNILLGDSICAKCGKKHKKIFEIDGKHYGSTCAKQILGEELTAPVWLYDLAEKWVKSDVTSYKDIGECTVNFFNEYGTGLADKSGSSKVWEKAIKINNKNVKVDWQWEINDYIIKRYSELNKL